MTETNATPTTTTRTLPSRDAGGPLHGGPVHCAQGAARPGPPACAARTRVDQRRVRVLPSRDARGRFVAFVTTSAPSWYILRADAHRIPGEADVLPGYVSAPVTPPQPLPAARVVRRARPWMRRDEIVNWVVMLLCFVGIAWYGFSLPVPHR